MTGMPAGGFRTLLIDPPWMERGGGHYKRGADRHYPLLHTKDIPGTIQQAPVWKPAERAHIYLWVTNNFLPDGLWVLSQLECRYVTMITWAKDRYGLGRYFRGQTEHLLFATYGGYLPPLARTCSTLVTAPRTTHSTKPQAAYALIESASPGPRAELFARHPQPGWWAWGNELDAGIQTPVLASTPPTNVLGVSALPTLWDFKTRENEGA